MRIDDIEKEFATLAHADKWTPEDHKKYAQLREEMNRLKGHPPKNPLKVLYSQVNNLRYKVDGWHNITELAKVRTGFEICQLEVMKLIAKMIKEGEDE